MYDRAPRTLTKPADSTGRSVGPGSYEPPESAPTKYTDGYAPFLSMTARETFLDVGDSIMAAPGPGQYDPAIVAERVKGGSTLANRSSRFVGKASYTPGPGAYNLQKRSDWLKEKYAQRELPPELLVNEGMKDGSIYKTSRITFQRKPDPPSIPSPGKAYGYEEAPDGSLRPQDIPNHDITMGPAYYNVNHEDTVAIKRYRGVHFGNRTSKRMQFKGSDGPGPGQYDPFNDPGIKAPIDLVIEENRKQPFDSNLPRYHEAIAAQEEKKAVPGPGRYEIKSQFSAQAPVPISQMDELIVHPPFGTQSRRFGNIKKDTPAPGTYNDPRNSLEILKRTTGLKQSPFGQTSVRFQGEHRVKRTPGPGAYSIPDMNTNLMRKAHVESNRKGAFGSTSSRIAPMTRRQEELMPGPAHYLTTEKSQNKEAQPSATFVSATGRLHTPQGVVLDNPPPGSYEVRHSHDATQGRVLYNSAQRPNRNAKKKGAFLSSANRFYTQNQVMSVEGDPGPGQYDVQEDSARGGLITTRQQRFTDVKSQTPGPGSYELSPLQMHTTLRGTFNATLNNPVSITYDDGLERRSPSKQAFLLGV
ncbi:sperm-tail PG-rich repeat-containing protein 2-like [Montipora foliosa]|uniref:sperm-tail PG-rich repeat-containing protein 2-like n=1 Tax=Montipora foliosa TaxID=591990 RepID=UPI0035F1A49B